MFDDVEQLEREIQAFRENMLASSNLIRVLENLVKENERQNTNLSANIENCTHDVKITSKDTLQKIDSKLDSCVKHLTQIIQENSKNNEDRLVNAVKELRESQKSSTQAIRDLSAQIIQSNTELSSKCDNVLEKLNSTNIEKIYNVCNDMKKQFENQLTHTLIKFAVIPIIFIGIISVCAVVALIFK